MKKKLLVATLFILTCIPNHTDCGKKEKTKIAYKAEKSQPCPLQFFPPAALTSVRAAKLIKYGSITQLSMHGMYASVLAGSSWGGFVSATAYLIGTAGFINNFFDAFYINSKSTH